MALDGGSGAGKSTLAVAIAQTLDAALIQSDDFFAADIPETDWDKRTPAQRARDCIDWRRLRRETLEPLLAGLVARWHPFDFEAGLRPDGTYGTSQHYVERQPKDIILLDGAYSTRPELADLIHLSILVEVPPELRYARLIPREDADFLQAWHARWDAAEAYYFTHIRPKHAFDLVVINT